MKLSYEKNPSGIIDKLLEYHDIDEIRAILNSKARKKRSKGNKYLTVAMNVYAIQVKNDSALSWAIGEMATNIGRSESTVRSHIEKFRKEVKTEIAAIKKRNYYLKGDLKYLTNCFFELLRQQIKRKSNDIMRPLDLSTLGAKALFDNILKEISNSRCK
ncbi:hypothetical protein [Sulfurovum riftiae]|uniref:Uncharacterized protein n=1 Tax=Sulfurovum riftiae TaxID=1630136 RepID=A0A151CDR7_9BACT|nr:hypothetical protein [Sulfurovum riftiae]KYJ85664.1 hypothetical protein AS592_01115 [Sulfurovum riftiae]